VHRRDLNDETLVFGNQGALWGNAMTWWDHGTGSVWSQPLGEAILGPRKGDRLELFPSSMTSWGAWREAHPETLTLDAPGGFDRISLRSVAIVVALGEETVAYPIPVLERELVINDRVAGVDIAVVMDPSDPTRWAVFSRDLGGTLVNLTHVDGTLVDPESGTTFDPVRGIGRGGTLNGQILGHLPAFTSFPRDVPTFWPEARFWDGSE
ncbi:MAG: DUF3179 domain-containing (seleno)protein, partial [Actinomycetota bacterium]|nr:DUF3179 domain-containing (seleno)protein [Actinomycetota bacterium]